MGRINVLEALVGFRDCCNRGNSGIGLESGMLEIEVMENL